MKNARISYEIQTGYYTGQMFHIHRKSRQQRKVEPFSQISWIHIAGFQLTVSGMTLQQTLSLFPCNWSNSQSKMTSGLEVCR